MKKVLFIFLTILIPHAILAEVTPNTPAQIAATSYIQGAYDTLDATKQDKLNANTVVSSGTGPIVTAVTASNGTVQVQKEEITIPVGSYTSSTSRAHMWVQ